VESQVNQKQKMVYLLSLFRDQIQENETIEWYSDYIENILQTGLKSSKSVSQQRGANRKGESILLQVRQSVTWTCFFWNIVLNYFGIIWLAWQQHWLCLKFTSFLFNFRDQSKTCKKKLNVAESGPEKCQKCVTYVLFERPKSTKTVPTCNCNLLMFIEKKYWICFQDGELEFLRAKT